MKSNEQDSKGGFNPAFLTCESFGKTGHNFMNCDKLDPAMAAFVLSEKKDEDDRKEMAKAQVNAALAAKGLGCSVLGRGAEPPQFWVLLIRLEPGISHVTWVHYDATMCLPGFVCSILPVLHFLRFDLCVL